ncbi:hypothetical protein BGW38_004975, partial [Lunasporangiospora selenospora]
GYCKGIVGRFQETEVDFDPSSNQQQQQRQPLPPLTTTALPGVTTVPPTPPPVPVKNRSRATSTASITAHPTDEDDQSGKNNCPYEEASPALSSLSKHTLLSAIAMDPHATERPGPRKLMSVESLRVVEVGKRPGLSSTPPPHSPSTSNHPELVPQSVPVIPPRSSSRQSHASRSHKHSSGVNSLASKSSSSSMSSLRDPNGSSATIITNSLEIKTPEQPPVPRSPKTAQEPQLSTLSSSTNSIDSRTESLGQSAVSTSTNGTNITPGTKPSRSSTPSVEDSPQQHSASTLRPSKTKERPSRRPSMDPAQAKDIKMERDGQIPDRDHLTRHASPPPPPPVSSSSSSSSSRRQPDNAYLSSVLEDLRNKTHHVLQRAGFSMAPTAGLYADRGSKSLDLRVFPTTTTTAAEAEPSSPLSETSGSVNVVSSSASTSGAVSFAIPTTSPTKAEADSGAKNGGGVTGAGASSGSPSKPVTRPRSRSFFGRGKEKSQDQQQSPSNASNKTASGTSTSASTSSTAMTGLLGSSPASTTSTSSSTYSSPFDMLRPWVKSDHRQRSNSGPARHSDPSIQQKLDSADTTTTTTPAEGEVGGAPVIVEDDDIDRRSHVSVPQENERKKPRRQRRTSEATAWTISTYSTTHSYQSQQASGSYMSTISSDARDGAVVDDDVDDNSDLDEEDEDEELRSDNQSDKQSLRNQKQGSVTGPGQHLNPRMADGRPSIDTTRLYINDYGFIYDLDDESIRGQDLSGNGSIIGTEALGGSSVSTISEFEKKLVVRRHKRTRESEIKWIQAVTRMHADHVKKSSKYKKLVRSGLPASVRGRVWLFLAKADIYRKPGLFEELQKRGPLPIHDVIERDIHRCYPDHIHFRDGMGTGQQDLHAVLRAYAHYKPEVGYCQGMGRLVGMMLMQMPVEDAFWLLVATIEGYMQDYYTPTLRQLKIDAQVFERLLKDQDPALADHLQRNDVVPLMYMTQWFMTLFTMSLPWASVLRVWDVFYYDGVKALFRVGLAVLQLCRDHLLQKCPSSSELLAYILHIPLDLLAPKPLLDTALHIKLKRNSVQKLIAVTAESMDAAAAAAAAKAQAQAKIKAQASTSTPTQAQTQAKAAAKAETSAEANTEAKAETKAEAEAEADVEEDTPQAPISPVSEQSSYSTESRIRSDSTSISQAETAIDESTIDAVTESLTNSTTVTASESTSTTSTATTAATTITSNNVNNNSENETTEMTSTASTASTTTMTTTTQATGAMTTTLTESKNDNSNNSINHNHNTHDSDTQVLSVSSPPRPASQPASRSSSSITSAARPQSPPLSPMGKPVPTVATTVPMAASSFSPLGVFRSRKRAGTIHK